VGCPNTSLQSDLQSDINSGTLQPGEQNREEETRSLLVFLHPASAFLLFVAFPAFCCVQPSRGEMHNRCSSLTKLLLCDPQTDGLYVESSLNETSVTLKASRVCCGTPSSAPGMLLVSGRQECQIIINATPAGFTQKPLLTWPTLPVCLIGWLPL